MSLHEQLKAKNLAARKAKDDVAKNIYNVLFGEIARVVDPGKEVDDATLSKVAEKTIAGIQTTLDKGGPNATLEREKELLSEFVIAKVSDAIVKAYVEEYIMLANAAAINSTLGLKQMGQVMGALKTKFGAENLDNGAASQIVKAALQ